MPPGLCQGPFYLLFLKMILEFDYFSLKMVVCSLEFLLFLSLFISRFRCSFAIGVDHFILFFVILIIIVHPGRIVIRGITLVSARGSIRGNIVYLFRFLPEGRSPNVLLAPGCYRLLLLPFILWRRFILLLHILRL